ncbi:MAG: prepilin-type N-terminal cleavage/methylation domain-containing protein [Acidobacteria bacterium]|nr:prepilin-type N-terminal cleavage/methylation domain-containing protein [Acidobacteriota bacterium]
MTPWRKRTQSGVTLLEMLIVVAIIGIIVGISFPSISAGIESLRLRSATDEIVSTFNSAMNRADRRQIAVEIVIDRLQGRLIFASADPGYRRELTMPSGVTIERILPVIPNLDENLPRQFLIHPGGTVPRIALELKNRRNVRRLVSVDPITGGAQVVEQP